MKTSLLRMSTLAALGVVLVARPALADPVSKETCIASYEAAQAHRRERKLLDARRDLLVCAQDACPQVLRTDCADWLRDTTRRLPSLVFEPSADNGTPLPEVRVALDGVVRSFDGRSVDVDPGEHTVRFEAAGYEPLTVRVVANEGESLQRVRATLTSTTRPPAPTPTASQQLPPAPPSVPPSRWPLYLTGGVAIVGAGVFAGFATAGYLKQSSTLESCSPTCDHSTIESVRARYLVADIGLVVAVASTAVFGVLWLTRSSPKSSGTAISSPPTPRTHER